MKLIENMIWTRSTKDGCVFLEAAIKMLEEAELTKESLRVELQQCRECLTEFVETIECYCSENPDHCCPIHRAQLLVGARISQPAEQKIKEGGFVEI